MKLSAFPLQSVEIGDAYSLNAYQKERAYLLSLEEGKFLAGFYENAGLKTSYTRYGGWENSLIAGHTLGHYMTAVAQAYANPATPEGERALFYKKAQNIAEGLYECQQNTKGKEGFVWGALPVEGGVEAQFDNVEQGRTNIVREAWVPWYTMHKLIAGLCDLYLLAGVARAKEVASALGDWVFGRVSRWDGETQKRVLAVEYGGMNDCLYTLFAITGKSEHALAAHAFDEEELFDVILSEVKDGLKDKHANTTIPKVLGALNRYLTLDGETFGGERVDASRYLKVAEIFWKTVIERHTYVTGGNSEWEHFGPDYVLDKERTNCNCETCNAYNMLKLSRLLFSVTGDKKYTDFYENTYINSILSSQNPETGMTTYFQPMASGFFKVYGEPFTKFWCCTGSGMESFTKLGDSVYYGGEDSLYIELYFSSRIRTDAFEGELDADFPFSDTAEFTLHRTDKPLKVYFRVPSWAKGGARVNKNEQAYAAAPSCGHIMVEMRGGDKVKIRLPERIAAESLPDAPDCYAFRYGPAVLSADLGTKDMAETVTGVDVTIPEKKIVSTERLYFPSVKAFLEDPSAFFRKEGESFVLTGADIELTFSPHFMRYKERYGIYWYLEEGERRPETYDARETADTVQPGYGQYENDALHSLSEEDTQGVTDDGTYRFARAGGYFAYDMAVLPGKKNTLCVQLRAEDNGRPLKITVGGEILLEERLLYTQGEREYFREIEIPAHVLEKARGKIVGGRAYSVLTVRFEGGEDEPSARVCGFIRILAE